MLEIPQTSEVRDAAQMSKRPGLGVLIVGCQARVCL